MEFGASLRATGFYHPSKRKALENRIVGQNIEQHLGDLYDRGGAAYLAVDETAIGMGVKAGRDALSRSGMAPAEIDLVLTHTLFPDYTIPGDSCAIAHELGCVRAAAYSIEAACASFLTMANMASAFLRTESYRNVLVIDVAHWATRALAEGQDPGPMGDAAAAVIFSRSPQSGCVAHVETRAGEHFSAMSAKSPHATGQNEYLTPGPLPSFRDYLYNDVPALIAALLDKARTRANDIRWFLPAQPSRGIMYKWAEDSGLRADSLLHTFETYGNLGAATVPTNLHHFTCVEPKIERGDTVLFFSTGAGFHLMASLWKY